MNPKFQAVLNEAIAAIQAGYAGKTHPRLNSIKEGTRKEMLRRLVAETAFYPKQPEKEWSLPQRNINPLADDQQYRRGGYGD